MFRIQRITDSAHQNPGSSSPPSSFKDSLDISLKVWEPSAESEPPISLENHSLRGRPKMNHWKSHRTTIFLSLLFLVLSLTPVAFGQTPSILGGAKERQPSYGELENFTILSYSDLDGWDQAAEFRVSKDGKHAYISNYQGFSILDVSDPAPRRSYRKSKTIPPSRASTSTSWAIC